jgi:hypothetical protein
VSDDPGADGLAKDVVIREALVNGLVSAFNQNGRMAARWYVVIEEVDPDDGTALWTVASDDLAIWDRLGLLEYALEYERDRVRQIRSSDG